SILVAEERFNLLRRRRQADQVEVEPANQGAAIRLRRRREAFLLQLGENEGINGGLGPAGIIAHLGHARLLHLAKRPATRRRLSHGACSRSESYSDAKITEPENHKPYSRDGWSELASHLLCGNSIMPPDGVRAGAEQISKIGIQFFRA